ncbi:MAG: hypothetical protein H7A51_11410 [Akkermansiaceae bacterium]|nr:hypothetical protein [Akkermansiaceae bacterium]
MRHLLVFGLLLAGMTGASAGFKIPSHVYRTGKLDEAVAEAQKEQKALAFVLTDEAST